MNKWKKDVRFEAIKKVAETKFKYEDLGKVAKLDSSSPPSVFIGSKLRYPEMNVGILSPLERDKDAWIYDDAKYWAENDFTIKDVVSLRDGLLNSRFKGKATDVRKVDTGKGNRFVQIAQEIALASKPVDVEIELERKVGPGIQKDKINLPQGMRAPLKKARIVSNIKVKRQVDKVVNDDIKAVEAVDYLYKKNFSEYVLSKILSVGVLGLKKDKKLVPTRWSITATDDMIGKRLIEQIKNYRGIENYELHFGEFMGNCYLILLFPNVWSYELFELYLPGSSWNPGKQIKAATDYELYNGRKSYAKDTAGGYYASRLPILEYLNKIKRQAAALAIRIELPTYWAALGVWVVRESVRKSLKSKGFEFNDIKELIESAKKIGMIKFGYDPEGIFKKSKLLEQINTQTTLGKWV